MEAATKPLFQHEAEEIAWYMTHLSVDELKRSLKLSPKLALESYKRFQDFHAADDPGLPALLAYTGVVFKHIHPEDFTAADFNFARQHLKIVSICYGLLSASDLIKPYRMEYDIKIPELTEGNMYQFWQGKQTQPLINVVQADDGILLNLASQDVQPAFHWKQIEKEVRVITPEFKIRKDGKLKTIVIPRWHVERCAGKSSVSKFKIQKPSKPLNGKAFTTVMIFPPKIIGYFYRTKSPLDVNY